MKKIIHLTVFLAVVGALSAGVLSYVNDLTAPIIEAQKLAAVKESLEVLYPGANFSELSTEADETGLVSAAYQAEGKGYIYSVQVVGYNSSTPIDFMMSIDNDGTISGYVVLTQQETNGIGSRVADDEFKNTVVGKGINDSISTLSGATVSSTAVVKGINAAKALYGAQAGVSVDTPSEPVVTTPVYTLSDDYSGNSAAVVSVDGNTYTVTANGFPGNSANEFAIVVENGAIVSVTNTVFGDTEGIGNAAVSEDALSAYVGATLTSEVDAVSGSTFTSKSVFAAMQAALKGTSSESTDASTEATDTAVEGDEYTATAQGFGGEVSVTVVLNGSDIVDVKVVGDSETSGIGTNAIDQLPAAIVAADSADVDAVSGATVTSTAILDAVKDALAQAGVTA
ncbi:MAG: FMN-binding protein, partial [Erysipelotrichaceae bacterium]|nr:FMN-binding protein [Erysipelotrichaceae bacterium]